MDKVVVIGGPTASGKSAFAARLAQEKGGTILNGDSLQVYAALQILTDQPSHQMQQEIPHQFYGFLDPTQPYSVGLWLSDVQKEIENSHQKGLLPIIVGGTGFYLKALLEGLSPLPPLSPHIREELEQRNCLQEVLYQELQSVDAALATRIHPHDRQRTLRGLEVFYGTKKPLTYWQTQKAHPLPYAFETILIMPATNNLHEKISQRIESMLEKGVLDEITAVLPLPLSSTAIKAIGLRELSAYLRGECSLDYAKERTFFHTCQYAKRQKTWFRHQFDKKQKIIIIQ